MIVHAAFVGALMLSATLVPVVAQGHPGARRAGLWSAVSRGQPTTSGPLAPSGPGPMIKG